MVHDGLHYDGKETFSVVVVVFVIYWSLNGDVCSINGPYSLRHPHIDESFLHLLQIAGRRKFNVPWQDPPNCLTNVMGNIKGRRSAYTKEVADATKCIGCGKAPQSDGDPFLHRDNWSMSVIFCYVETQFLYEMIEGRPGHPKIFFPLGI